MGGIDGVERRRTAAEMEPYDAPLPKAEARRAANEANAPSLEPLRESIKSPYPSALFVQRPEGQLRTLGAVTEEILRLRSHPPPASDPKAKAIVDASVRALTNDWIAKAHAVGMKEPSASFSPWTASDAELKSAFLFTHVAGVVPLDAARQDGGLRFKEDIFEAVALRTRGLDDALLDSYASDPGTQRQLLERELRRLGDTAQCSPSDSVDDLRRRRGALVAGFKPRGEDHTLFIGLDGKVGTLDALVDYELSERVRASNPGTTLGSLAASAAAVNGGDTDDIRRAGKAGNAVEEAAQALAGGDGQKLGAKPAAHAQVYGRRRPLPDGPGLGRRTRSAGGTMPRRGANTTEAGATTSARSRTPAGFNDKHLGGEIRGGRAMGVHHEPSGEGTSRTMPGTVSKPDKHGVYTARVQVRADDGTWVDKHAPSTFFPKTWTRSEVRTCILEAFANREDLGGGNWSGKTRSGITVQGHSDARGVIDSAYPLWE